MQTPGPAPGLLQQPFTWCLLPGAASLSVPAVFQLFLLLCFISCAWCPLPSFYPLGCPPAITVCLSAPRVCLGAQLMPEGPKSICPVSANNVTHLFSITQSVPLDTSKLPMTSSCFHTHIPKFGSAHPATDPNASTAARAVFSGLLNAALVWAAPGLATTLWDTVPTQLQWAGQQSYHQPTSDFCLGVLSPYTACSLMTAAQTCSLPGTCSVPVAGGVRLEQFGKENQSTRLALDPTAFLKGLDV